MDFREKTLYHQIHPAKLATDIGVTPLALYFFWEHRVLPGLLVGFVPPLIVSLAMLKWMPNLEELKRSAFGRYIKKYMTPFIELTRLLTLVPMAYGAWSHDFRFIVLALVILVVAWCNGLVWKAFSGVGLWTLEDIQEWSRKAGLETLPPSTLRRMPICKMQVARKAE